MATDTNALHIRFTGNITPDMLRSRELGEIIAAYEDSLAATVVHQTAGLKKENVVVGLVGIQSQSVGLTFAAPLGEPVYVAAMQIATAIKEQSWTEVPWTALKSLRKILSFLKQGSYEAHFTATYNGRAVRAMMSPQTVIPESVQLYGKTEIVGLVKRVGGLDPKVMLQTLQGETLYCDTTEEIAKQLGNFLYQEVNVAGLAEWDLETLEITDFEITGVLPYRRTSPSRAFKRLREHFATYFDDIDSPENWISELRSETGQ